MKAQASPGKNYYTRHWWDHCHLYMHFTRVLAWCCDKLHSRYRSMLSLAGLLHLSLAQPFARPSGCSLLDMAKLAPLQLTIFSHFHDLYVISHSHLIKQSAVSCLSTFTAASNCSSVSVSFKSFAGLETPLLLERAEYFVLFNSILFVSFPFNPCRIRSIESRRIPKEQTRSVGNQGSNFKKHRQRPDCTFPCYTCCIRHKKYPPVHSARSSKRTSGIGDSTN
jgi:hypothetical protein